MKFLDPWRGLEEVLLVSGETLPEVTPERLAQLYEQGMLAHPPITVEGHGTLLIPSANQTAGGLKHYLVDNYGSTDLYA